MRPWIAGLDIGGTRVKAAAYGVRKGDVLSRRAEPTRDGEQRDGLPAWAWTAREILTDMTRSLGGEARAIGVACPGLAAADHRSIAYMPGRLKGLEGLDWPRLLQREGSVIVINDAQAALLGEVWQGAARGMRDVILLTLGTGVGGAILSDGWLLHGHTHKAGHLGHISLDPEGSPDITGMPGSLEQAIGEATLAERSAGRFRTTADLLAAAAAGDEQAARVWQSSVRALGCGLASLVNVLDPEAIVLGGGITESGPALYEPLQRVLDEVEWRPTGTGVKLLKARMGEWAGTAGAAWFANTMGAQMQARENHPLAAENHRPARRKQRPAAREGRVRRQ